MIVITAATGRLGRAVAAELAARGRARDVKLTARSPKNLEAFGERGFTLGHADYDDLASLEAAFVGAEVLLLISGVSRNEQRIEEHRRAIDAAKRAGVARIVYTSFTNPSPKSLFPVATIHGDTEAYLRSSGVAFTILRNNQFAANLDAALEESKANDLLASPAADAKVAYVTHADAAAAAVGALLGHEHAGKVYEITGPEALDLHEIAAALATLRGRSVNVLRSSLEERKAYFQSMHLPPYVVAALVGSIAATAAGEYAQVSQDAARLAGRATQSMRDYLRAFV